jgi:hypothetical protein
MKAAMQVLGRDDVVLVDGRATTGKVNPKNLSAPVFVSATKQALIEALAERLRSEDKANTAWEAFRHERDRLLASSDWTQLADAPIDQQAWAVYRQSLRDLPEAVSDPAGMVWPEPPGPTSSSDRS